MRARELILSAEARLRYYAYVPGANDAELTHARDAWNKALDILWESLRERTQPGDGTHSGEALAAFTQATDALVVLIEVLEGRHPSAPA